MATQKNFSRANIKTPKLSKGQFIWLAEILGSGIRDGETVRQLADRMIRDELPGTNGAFCPDTFQEAVKQFSWPRMRI